MTEPGRAGWGRHLWLLWGLRVTLARGSLVRGAALLPTLAGAISLGAFTVVAASGSFRLFTSQAVLDNPPLDRFLELLLGFLASTMWIAWPVVTASVDDAAELSRFALFPIPPGRLFAASVLAGLVEPRAFPIWGALWGMVGAEYMFGAHLAIAIPATIGLALCSIVWGRVGLHALLNVLRHRRSAEAMGGGLIVLLGCAAFVPPPNLEWLRHLNAASPAVDDALLRGATDLFMLLPTGGWATAIFADVEGAPVFVVAALLYLGVATVVGYVLAYWLLDRFHRRAGRALPQRPPQAETAVFSARRVRWVLVERELRDAWLNPRTRLTLALPFFLAILLKLVGARALAMELIGPVADGYLVGGLASYGAFVLGAGFAQNCFGYDAGGAQLLFGAPVDLRDVLRAKNYVHAGMAFALCLILVGFYCAYVGMPSGSIVTLAVCNAFYQVLLFVALGNILSILSPRKFHPSLKRRDRASALATAVGLGAASLSVMPGFAILRLLRDGHTGAALGIGLVILPALAVALWRISVPLALGLLETRRAELLRAVVRE